MQNKKLIIGITAEGSVNLLTGQLAYFKNLGYDTYLLAPFSERAASFCEKEGCEHLILKISREISFFQDLKTLWQIYIIFKRIKPDIVNLGTPKISLLGMLVAAFLGVKKRIYTCRGFRFEHEKGFKKSILIGMEKLTVFLSHSVICISNSVQDFGIEKKIFTKNNSIVINKGSSNGVNLELFDKSKIKKETIFEFKQKLNLNDNFIYGFVGRIVDRKGINELIEAFNELYQLDKKNRLLLVGPFELNQIENKNLLNYIENHEGIKCVGRIMQHEVPNYLALMDVFVLPAWWEGFGNVLIQAASMQIPVITTNATGTRDAVSQDFNGILVAIKDVESLKRAMLKLKIEKDLRDKLGLNGLEWSKNFKSIDIWHGINEIYLN
jgi:glycosyltransferase involved in cell wall biosynthesis